MVLQIMSSFSYLKFTLRAMLYTGIQVANSAYNQVNSIAYTASG